MRDYGKVHTSFWSSATIRALSDEGRLLATYLMTSPHSTIAGVFRLPDGYVCEDMQWTPEQVSRAFAELFDKGFANRCETTKWVWVIKHLEWNPPENPNQRKSASKVALSVPDECPWKRDFMRICGPSLELSQPEPVNPSPTVPQPLANQEPEQEPEQKQEQEKKTPRKRVPVLEKPDDVLQQTWTDWTQLRKDKRATVSETVVAEARLEAAKAHLTLERFLTIWCLRGSQGLQADWLKPNERGSPGQSEPEWRTEQRQRTQLAAPGVASAKPAGEFFIDVEAINVTTDTLD